MIQKRKHTYVGFGFGAIQSGLFIYEAFRSKAFRRLVVAEVLPEIVTAVRRFNNRFNINIAFQNGVESVQINSIEMENPAEETDRKRLIDAIVEADEIGTALPSVDYYVSKKPGSLHQLLATGLINKIKKNGPRVVIYTAENNNHAAETLEAHVMALVPEKMRERIRSQALFLNTVIGKMSQVITDPQEIKSRGLVPMATNADRAFLVESFNKILISRIHFTEPFQRGIHVFEEKDDLMPFEEAKLYGHNATHALIGYLGALRGAEYVADLPESSGIIPFARSAFLDESGKALIRKHQGIDQVFTSSGYREFADDLLARMTNPFLMDSIERVTRDTERKLDWNDRLIGTMRVALSQGVKPNRYAIGAAAALITLNPSILENEEMIEKRCDDLWQKNSVNRLEKEQIVQLITAAVIQLSQWKKRGFPDIELFMSTACGFP